MKKFVPVFFFLLASIVDAAQQPKVSPDVWKKAKAEGTVAVLVGLVQSSPQVDRKEIKERQDAVLKELEGTKYKVRRRFEEIYVISLEVEPYGLDILENSVHVQQVERVQFFKTQPSSSMR
jgi:hypothetical protein